MAQTRKDLLGRVLRRGESQRRSDGRYQKNWFHGQFYKNVHV